MHQTKSFTSIMIALGVNASAAAALFQGDTSYLTHFVNNLFYLALPCTLLGGLLFLLERGAFHTTRYGFRRMFLIVNEKQAALLPEEEQMIDRDMPRRTYSFRLTYPLLFTGIILAGISIAIGFAV